MKIKEAIVLAGGLGTRLRSVVKDVPKPMADVNGKPFLEYILDYLLNSELEKVILSVGYKYEVILKYFGEKYKDLVLIYSIEDEPLGTGGAIKKSLSFVNDKDILILNGDTFFKIDFFKFLEFHKSKKADLSIALKPMKNFDRYGTVEIDSNYRIIGFKEKTYKKFGLINGGVYLLKTEVFKEINFPEKFSFEKEFLEKFYENLHFFGLPFDNYFIDIGIPEDYERAKRDFGN